MIDSSNVSLIIVSFQSEAALISLLPSIPDNVEVIIVNNSSDQNLERLKKIKKFKEIKNLENKGFGTACNIGVKEATKDFIFLLNPDTILHKNCISNLTNAVVEIPNASAFTPKILGKKNKEQFKRRSILLDKKKWLKKPPNKVSEIPVMGGAAIFLKKENYLKVGGFDENIFLYHEDDDLTLRLKKEVGPLIYYPKAQVTHQGGNSSSRSPYIAALKGFHMGKSRVYSMKKYNVKNYRIKCFSIAIMQLISFEMIFSQRKRSKYYAFFRAIIEELREEKKMILVTGGSGFIGANFILNWFSENEEPLVNLDKLTYASNQDNLKHLKNSENYFFEKGSIEDLSFVTALLEKYQPRAVINFAAESHVDRSISDSDDFIQTNILGTHTLLKASLKYFETLKGSEKDNFRYIQISTDEVYGSLKDKDPQSLEDSPYFPNSPYSASKASGDHLARAWHETFGLPVITTNCTNNYGPFQHEEKLIPLMISHSLKGKKLPIYGDGTNVRDWLYVKDHCDALSLVLKEGRTGETYNIGGKNEIKNIEVVTQICNLLDDIYPKKNGGSYSDQITFVEDRLGHDYRYGLNISKIENEIGWSPKENFDSGINKTVEWYLRKIK